MRAFIHSRTLKSRRTRVFNWFLNRSCTLVYSYSRMIIDVNEMSSFSKRQQISKTNLILVSTVKNFKLSSKSFDLIQSQKHFVFLSWTLLFLFFCSPFHMIRNIIRNVNIWFEILSAFPLSWYFNVQYLISILSLFVVWFFKVKMKIVFVLLQRADMLSCSYVCCTININDYYFICKTLFFVPILSIAWKLTTEIFFFFLFLLFLAFLRQFNQHEMNQLKKRIRILFINKEENSLPLSVWWCWRRVCDHWWIVGRYRARFLVRPVVDVGKSTKIFIPFFHLHHELCVSRRLALLDIKRKSK